MKPLRWWAPLLCAVIALMFGFLPYGLLSGAGKLPLGLRDNPWPMEIVAALATVATIVLAVFAYRQKRARAVATAGAVLATLSTGIFFLLVHVASYELPPPSRELAAGTAAPDFTLPDEAGSPVALASLRGQKVLLVFYRGAW
jgi:cytochrome oxidase Cu insertion factor (SCO1/SenC/PrrC family)